MATSRFMLSGLAAAILLNLPFYAYALDRDWSWASGFLAVWTNNSLGAFLTFFHEIGHTLAGWFYGIPTIPLYDFAHGGGWAWFVTGQQIPLALAIWAGLVWLGYRMEYYGWLRALPFLLAGFGVATAFTDAHRAAIAFAGPATEAGIGGFFLIRALFDIAPRGPAERFLNAALGFAFPLHSLIDGYSLLRIASARTRYYGQKDAQGAGDFDQIADKLAFATFDGAVILWMAFAAVSLVLPFALYLRYADRDTNC